MERIEAITDIFQLEPGSFFASDPLLTKNVREYLALHKIYKARDRATMASVIPHMFTSFFINSNHVKFAGFPSIEGGRRSSNQFLTKEGINVILSFESIEDIAWKYGSATPIKSIPIGKKEYSAMKYALQKLTTNEKL